MSADQSHSRPSTALRIGVLRLADSAPVIVAQAYGLFAELGLDVAVSVEPSWANLADKLTWGALDAAVMLPPLVLAAAAGLRGARSRLIVPMGLTRGGNTVVVSPAAAAVAASVPGEGALDIGRRLVGWMRAQPQPPRLAVVHAYSTHNLLLRYWLAASGADPDRDMRTVIVPPEAVLAELAAGRIDGFCAGAPWGDAAAGQGAGTVLLGSSAIWAAHPEKCLAVAAAWAEANPAPLQALLRALLRAGRVCDDPRRAPALASLLAGAPLHLPEPATTAALPGGTAAERIGFHAGGAWYPAPGHADWFLGQMRRWGWLTTGSAPPPLYRPDLAAAAAAAEHVAAPPERSTEVFCDAP